MAHGVSFAGQGMTVTGPDGTVFENVDLEVEPASLAVVAGESGSGRTSLLLALSGRLSLTAGRLEVGGHRLPAQAATVRRLVAPARLRPGVELEPRLRVREVITETLVVAGANRQAIGRSCALVGLHPEGGELVERLPPVEQLLLAVALAVAGRPGALVVDDVDTGLSPESRERAWQALHTVTETGVTVVATATEAPAWAPVALDLRRSGSPPELAFFDGLPEQPQEDR
ncbi:ATP-binding cassette domain-containing protein [Amycolatopsis anabasis]|uniref:ATP-binding cassette domain-containing protein n=1 Tax=Amycolatopsis anabasis TaxID=1840409 RepID=UPI00131E1CD1|nr:ATP-binding cassette domain-containing protein [Amycolatopsis anabasis]